MRYHELTDEQWEFIEPLLPPKANTGRRRADDRMTINGILYVLTTGCRWMDMPKRYGDDSTANRRLKQWEKKGVWKRIMDAILGYSYSNKKLEMKAVVVDSSDVPAKKGERW
jgi:transposase